MLPFKVKYHVTAGLYCIASVLVVVSNSREIHTAAMVHMCAYSILHLSVSYNLCDRVKRSQVFWGVFGIVQTLHEAVFRIGDLVAVKGRNSPRMGHQSIPGQTNSLFTHTHTYTHTYRFHI